MVIHAALAEANYVETVAEHAPISDVARDRLRLSVERIREALVVAQGSMNQKAAT